MQVPAAREKRAAGFHGRCRAARRGPECGLWAQTRRLGWPSHSFHAACQAQLGRKMPMTKQSFALGRRSDGISSGCKRHPAPLFRCVSLSLNNSLLALQARKTASRYCGEKGKTRRSHEDIRSKLLLKRYEPSQLPWSCQNVLYGLHLH